MFSFCLKRLIQVPLILLILVTLSFFLVRLAPGGPFIAERSLSVEAETALNEKYGFDKPLPVQYVQYVGGVLQGDLGLSTKQRDRTINEIIAATLPNSITVGALAFCIALMIGVVCGVIAAVKHHSWLDWTTMSGAVFGISIPVFVIGPMMQWLFSRKLGLLPFAGYEGLTSPIYLILPALTLALPFAARFSRLMRTGMLEVLHEDFIRTARAKGLKGYVIITKHALRGALIPVATYAGPAAAAMMTGSLVVEKIYQIPGLGSEFVQGALNRDYFLVMGTAIVYGTLLVLFNLISDVTVAILDPRIRLK